MNRIGKLLCLVMLFLGQRGFAENCSPCFNWCDLSYSVYADYLYWKVTKPESTNVSGNEAGTLNAITKFQVPNYSSGYRIGAAVFYNCFNLDARYSFLRNSSAATLVFSPAALFPFQSINYQLDYRVLDLTFGYTYYLLCHRGYIKPYLGAKLAWLHEKSTNDFISAFGDTSTYFSIKTNGYGPMVGFESCWELFRCWIPISLIARGDFSVLSATSFYNNSLITSGPPLGVSTFPNGRSTFPVVTDIYIALGFDICNFTCFSANLQVGYEAQGWMNMREIEGTGLGTLGLGGLVVHGNVIF